jgi:hypothetical protein
LNLTRFDLLSLFTIAFSAYIGLAIWNYKLIIDPGITAWMRWYYSYAPDLYRIGIQLSVLLDNHPFPLFTWMSLMCFGSLFLAYLIIRPDHEDAMVLIAGSMWLALFSYPFVGVAYVVVALLAKYRNHRAVSLLLPILAILREVTALTAFVFLWFYSKNKREAVMGFAGAAAAYYIMRFLLIGDMPYAYGPSSFFLLLSLLSYMSTTWAFKLSVLTTSIILFAVRTKRELIFILVNLIPFLCFAHWFELQLWLPILLCMMGAREASTATTLLD